jgi:hypothetical protein
MRVTQLARTNSGEALLHQGVIRTNCLPTKCDIWELLCLLQLLYPFQWQTHSPPYWGQCGFPFLPWTALNFQTGMTDLPIYPVVAGLATIESAKLNAWKIMWCHCSEAQAWHAHELECFRLNISKFFTNPMKSSHEHIVKIAQNTAQAKSGLKLSGAVIWCTFDTADCSSQHFCQ